MQQSMGFLLEETDAAGIIRGVCHGRARDGSHNDALVALMRQDPGRFTGLADIPLTDMGQAIEEARRCRADLGLPDLMLESGTRAPPTYPDDVRLYPSMNSAGSATLRFSLPIPRHNDWPQHAPSASSQAVPGGFPRNCRT